MNLSKFTDPESTIFKSIFQAAAILVNSLILWFIVSYFQEKLPEKKYMIIVASLLVIFLLWVATWALVKVSKNNRLSKLRESLTKFEQIDEEIRHKKLIDLGAYSQKVLEVLNTTFNLIFLR